MEIEKKGWFHRFWSLDNTKTFMQASITCTFFGFILGLMDSVALFPFNTARSLTPEMKEIMHMIRQYPPSLFIGFALTIVVMTGRDIAAGKKVLAAAVAAALGLLAEPSAVMLPLVYLLMKPVMVKKEEVEAVVPIVAPEETYSAPEAAAPAPEKSGDEKPPHYVDPIQEFLKKT